MPYTINSAFNWPHDLKRERFFKWIPDFGNEASPPALDGTRQFRNSNGGGLWRAVFGDHQLHSFQLRLLWRSTEIALRGGMTPCDVDYCGDGVGITGVIAVGTWAARAVGGTINVSGATGLVQPGMHFSVKSPIYGWRMHRIETVDFATGGGHRSITFWPPLRFEVPVVASSPELEFDSPRCVMRLAQSDSMDAEFELRRHGHPNAEFIEAF